MRDNREGGKGGEAALHRNNSAFETPQRRATQARPDGGNKPLRQLPLGPIRPGRGTVVDACETKEFGTDACAAGRFHRLKLRACKYPRIKKGAAA